MFKKIGLMIALFILGSVSLANAAGFSVTSHVDGSVPVWHAQASMLHNTKDTSTVLGAGMCTGSKWDFGYAGTTIIDAGQLCGYGTGSVSGASQFAPLVTTGGTIFGVPQSHWDIGFNISGQTSGIYVGAGLLIPLQ